MRTDFEKLNVPGVEIYAASVTHLDTEFRVNVMRSHNPLPSMSWVFEIAEGDGYYTDVIGKGFGTTVEEAMRKSVTKCIEIAQAHANEAPIACATVELNAATLDEVIDQATEAGLIDDNNLLIQD